MGIGPHRRMWRRIPRLALKDAEAIWLCAKE